MIRQLVYSPVFRMPLRFMPSTTKSRIFANFPIPIRAYNKMVFCLQKLWLVINYIPRVENTLLGRGASADPSV